MAHPHVQAHRPVHMAAHRPVYSPVQTAMPGRTGLPGLTQFLPNHAPIKPVAVPRMSIKATAPTPVQMHIANLAAQRLVNSARHAGGSNSQAAVAIVQSALPSLSRLGTDMPDILFSVGRAFAGPNHALNNLNKMRFPAQKAASVQADLAVLQKMDGQMRNLGLEIRVNFVSPSLVFGGRSMAG